MSFDVADTSFPDAAFVATETPFAAVSVYKRIFDVVLSNIPVTGALVPHPAVNAIFKAVRPLAPALLVAGVKGSPAKAAVPLALPNVTAVVVTRP